MQDEPRGHSRSNCNPSTYWSSHGATASQSLMSHMDIYLPCMGPCARYFVKAIIVQPLLSLPCWSMTLIDGAITPTVCFPCSTARCSMLRSSTVHNVPCWTPRARWNISWCLCLVCIQALWQTFPWTLSYPSISTSIFLPSDADIITASALALHKYLQCSHKHSLDYYLGQTFLTFLGEVEITEVRLRNTE